MVNKTTKTIDVRKIFRDINKRIKENENVIFKVNGGERRGMSCMAIKIGELNFEKSKGEA